MTAPVCPAWLMARPIAHRGLHDARAGRVENSPAAARAAVEAGYAIECDTQPSADGEAMVFHDFALDRLTNATGPVAAMSARVLQTTPYRVGSDRIVTFATLLALVAGRVPVVCEIKSAFDGDMRLAERVAAVAASAPGPVCLKSFDPAVIAHLRAHRGRLGIDATPLGMVAQARYDDPDDEWARLPADEKRALAQFLHWEATRPDFLSYGHRDLPHAVPHLCRAALGAPVMTWTVRTSQEAMAARPHVDQIIFEGWRPPHLFHEL